MLKYNLPERELGQLMKVNKNIRVTMRDGVKLAADLYLPDSEGRFPALLSMDPYNKNIEQLEAPPGKGLNLEYVNVEAGDHKFWTENGYVHIIADVRGTGNSEGEYHNWLSNMEQDDGYELIEWIAQQPWCDGNVGMIGISYLAIIQYLVAAKQPPHLKAICPIEGWGDTYRDVTYHGGIPSVFPAVLSKTIPARKAVPVSREMYGEKLTQIQNELKEDEAANLNKNPLLYTMLEFPDAYPIAFDFLVNREDGPYYWERSPSAKMDKIQVPTFLGCEMHSKNVGMHLPGAIRGWERINAPKKLLLYEKLLERPFHEFHDEMLRWFNFWLKGINSGIMEESKVKVWVRGSNKWRTGNEWPLLSKTVWKKYYLQNDQRLSEETPLDEKPDKIHYEAAMPVAYASAPFSPKPQYLTYSTSPLEEGLEVTGPIALYLQASLSSEDGDFIIVIKDVGPNGAGVNLTRGWLRASHRELDPKESKAWKPYHVHTNPKSVIPGQVIEYAIEIQPIANFFEVGHKLQLEIWPCDYPAEPYYDYTLLWGLNHHIPYGKPLDYEILHTPKYPSYLLLPTIKEE